MKRLAKRATVFRDSPIRDMKRAGVAMVNNGIDVVFLHQGEPDFPTPTKVVEAVEGALRAGCTKYVSAEGVPELKDAIRQKLTSENGLADVRREELVITNGAKLALYLALQATVEAGDHVVGISPYFGPYRDVIESTGGRFIAVDLVRDPKRHELDRDRLRAALSTKTKAILINTPQNPSGTVWTREDLEFVARMAEEFDCYIISDEVYERMVFDGRRHHSIASFSRAIQDRTILVNSFSKTYAMTGWRLGYAVANEKLIRVLADLHHASGRCATAFVQQAGIAALYESEAAVAQMVAEYQARRDLVIERLGSLDGVLLGDIEGTFYAFPDISGLGIDSTALAEDLLRSAHVAVVPGSFFGDDASIRISFATARDRLAEGLERIRRYLAQLAHGS